MLRKRTKKLLAPLLVLALLACHGAYSAAEHLSLFELLGVTQLEAPHTGLPADDGAERHGWDVDAASYAAVLMVVAAVVWRRLREGLRRSGGPPLRRSGAHRAPPKLLPQRPPTASLLQVYRL